MSVIDKYYHPMNDFSKLKLVGQKTSMIEFDEKNKNWKLSLAGTNVSGISYAPQNTFLLGRQRWTIYGDSDCKIEGEANTTKHLKLTGCNSTGHFTCNDGQCVTMEQRCNQLPDCRDRSDEKNCKVLVLEEGYNPNVPPVPVDDQIMEW